ncbi:MAG: alcohol dehydrogenase [bacterium]|nr:MAG: Iron-containing alcohol dehydrogenase [bacterium 42_11]MDK2872235.1 alcohol dehydrogenase [bacterium]
MLVNFNFNVPSTIVFGVDTVNQTGQYVRKLNGKRAFVITDPGVAKAGILEKVLRVLREDGIEAGYYDGVIPEPPENIVAEIVDKVKDGGYEVIIGLGGGSSMDTAKVVSVLVTNGGTIRDYLGIDKIPKPGLPKIMIPTTAGTGSEVTQVAIFTLVDEKVKKGVVSSYLLADVAIVDPALTYNLPPEITAATGMDALIHAIESYIARKANKFTEGLSLMAMELIARNIRTAVTDGSNTEARYNMSLGSLLAGIAFGNSSCAAVHALALALGGKFHIPHGVANTLMLPYVMEYNVVSRMEKFVKIVEALGEKVDGLSLRDAAFKAIDAMVNIARDIGVPTRLRDLNVPKEAIPEMAKAAINETRLLSQNPRVLTLKDIENIYNNAW